MLPLVYFTHADVKNTENFNANFEYIENNKFEENSILKSSSSIKKRLKLTVNNETMNYEATEEDESPYTIGILNKTTNKLSMVKTPFFVLKPECYTNKRDNEILSDKLGTFSDKLNSLTAAFGSSRKRKAMQTKIRNKLDTETLDEAVNGAVKATIENKTLLNTSNEENNEGDDSTLAEQYSIIPVPNKNAQKPVDVYSIEEILITKTELDIYTIELGTRFAGATNDMMKYWKEKCVYPEYVCDRLQLVATSRVQQHKLLKCKLLAYMNYLIRLYQLKSAQLRSKTPMKSYEINDALANRLLDTYTVISSNNASNKNMRSMPRRLKDKLICHIMILGLHIDDFVTDLQSLQKDLKISIDKLNEYYLALGCHVKSSVTTVNNRKLLNKSAFLTIPLNEVKKIESKKRSRK